MKAPYFGSVRFFKNLILLAVIIAIAVPTVLAVRFSKKLDEIQQALAVQEVLPDPVSSEDTSASAEEASSSASDPASSAIAADLPSYASAYPDFYASQPLTADQSTEKTAFLTFDDGPSDRTDEILTILAQKDVKATFFVIGKTDDVSRQRMKNVVAAGHTLGMHSYSHDYKKIYASVEDYLADMYDLFCLIRDTTGTTPTVFRLPGGSINGYDYGIYREILSEMLRRGFVPCDWNVSSQDATGSPISVAQMTSTVLSVSKNDNRSFILMHDAADKKTTVAALPGIIDGLKQQGYTLLPLTGDIKPVLFGYPE